MNIKSEPRNTVGKNNGKLFEEDFKKSISPEIWSYRPPDTGGGMMARFTSESLCDLFVYNPKIGELSLIELKSTVGTSMSVRPKSEVDTYLDNIKKYELWKDSRSPLEKKKSKEEMKQRRKELRIERKKLNSAMIKYHQIESLYKTYKEFGIKGYIAFTFFKYDKTYLLPIQHFYDWWVNNNKKSINSTDLDDLVEKRKCYFIEQEYLTARSKRSYYNLKIFEGEINNETN